MTTLAFTDAHDGYYQCESEDGSTPEWAAVLTPCAVRPAPVAQPTPLQATPFQFKAALVKQGLYTQAVTAVNAADQLTQLAWAEAQTFIEDDAMVTTMAAALGKTTADVHALFQLAQTLNP